MKDITQLPINEVSGYGNTLMNWLGVFWDQIYQDPDFMLRLQQGQGLLAAQLYLDFLENMELLNRNNVPVLHRERWKPVIIKQSAADTGDAAVLTVGDSRNIVAGPQENNAMIPGSTLAVGSTAALAGVVSYPLSDIMDIITSISDNIIMPGTVLVNGVDFSVSQNTIMFRREKDPFLTATFPQRQIVNADGTTDLEIVLWCSDVLIDKDYLYDHSGYILGIKTQSTSFHKNLLNRVWDMVNFGAQFNLLQSCLGAMMGEPTILNETETVELIINDNITQQVVTDKEVYTLSIAATLRSKVQPTATMIRGEFLTESIRI